MNRLDEAKKRQVEAKDELESVKRAFDLNTEVWWQAERTLYAFSLLFILSFSFPFIEFFIFYFIFIHPQPAFALIFFCYSLYIYSGLISSVLLQGIT